VANQRGHGYGAFMASVDGLVMARGSYETILSFEIRPHEKPVVVQTRTMGDADVPNHLKGRVYITEEKLLCVVEDLATDGWAADVRCSGHLRTTST
jgi:hypothetical protein